MHLNVDLRFAVPPLVNILYRLLFSDDEGGNHPTLNTSSVTLRGGNFFSFIPLMLISIKLPLKFSVEFPESIQIQLQFGCTDGNFYYNISLLLLGVTLLASFAFRPLLFWYTYFFSIIIFLISPWLFPLLNFPSLFLTKLSILTSFLDLWSSNSHKPSKPSLGNP